MEKKVNVSMVRTIPIKHHEWAASRRFWAKCHQAPAKKTKANTSKAPATINPALATHAASKPAEAKYFWNWAKRSRPTHRKWAPPMILSKTLNSQKMVQ
ncbi:MAG: hypothetical protein CL829_04480 [Crocinitomicaceae bacterium]|nr:hypothetical protein [Crocinitomicaceae bacterium]